MLLLLGLFLIVWGFFSLFRFTISLISYFLMLVGILLIILFFAHHWLFSLIIIGLIVYSIQTKKRRFVDRPQTSRTNFGGRRDISDEAEQSDVK